MLAGCLFAALIASAHAQEGMVQMGGTAKTPDFYTIQAGDTLWDISTRFLGDPYQWPQLWSYNEYITNPHWIYPGNQIYFNLGDSLTPPAASVEPVQDVPYQPPPQVVATNDSDCDFPARYDDVRRGQTLSAPGVLGSATDINARGRLIASDVPGSLIGEGNYVYLKMDDMEGVGCGTVLSLYRKQAGSVRTAGGVSNIFQVVAEVRVIRTDDKVATAEVRDSFIEAERGDIVGDHVVVDVTVDVDPPEGDTEARVIGRLNVQQAMPSTTETVFLDVGTDDGVDVGTAMYLVAQRDGLAGRFAKPDKRLPERVTGRVVVVRADAHRSTAVVIDAADSFEVGARLVATPNRE